MKKVYHQYQDSALDVSILTFLEKNIFGNSNFAIDFNVVDQHGVTP